MSNIINTQNSNTETPVFATKIAEGTFSRYSQAPSVIHKYSLNNALKGRDEFRKSANFAYNENKKRKENTSIFNKLLLALSGIGIFVVLEKKNII